MIPIRSLSTIANYNSVVTAVNRERTKHRGLMQSLYDEQKGAADRFEDSVKEIESRVQLNHKNAEMLKNASARFAQLTGV